MVDVGPGDKITWEVNGGRVAVTTERPAFWRWIGTVKGARMTRCRPLQKHASAEGASDVRRVVVEANVFVSLVTGRRETTTAWPR